MFLIAVDCLMLDKKDIGYANEKISKLSEQIKKYDKSTLAILSKSKRIFHQSDNTLHFSGKEYGNFHRNINTVFNKNKYTNFIFLDITHDLTDENIKFLLDLKCDYSLTKLLYLNHKIKISYHLFVPNSGYRTSNSIDLLTFNHENYCNTYSPLTGEFIDLASIQRANNLFSTPKKEINKFLESIYKFEISQNLAPQPVQYPLKLTPKVEDNKQHTSTTNATSYYTNTTSFYTTVDITDL